MPLFFIHARNSEFRARDNGAEFDTPEAALAMGVKSAIAMAADEIGHGHRSAAVEVNVEQEDGTCLLSSVVAISVSPLIVAEQGSDEQLLANDDEHS